MIQIVAVYSAAQCDVIRTLFREYADELREDLCFQSFNEELATLPGPYATPKGRLLLARVDSQPAGCVAFKTIGEGICEMKRLYVRPAFRGLKIGRCLAVQIIEDARQAGYRTMRLDTLRRLQEAFTLYGSLGFCEISPYYHNPIEGCVFMELRLA